MHDLRKTGIILSLLLLWHGTPSARAATHDKAAIAAVNARDDLYTRGSQQQDVALLSSIWAESFIDTNGAGVVRNKQQMLAVIAAARKSGEKILSISITNRRTQVYGDAAVVTGMYTMKIAQNSQTQTAKGRFTDVWIKQHNSWNCVAAHSSPLK